MCVQQPHLASSHCLCISHIWPRHLSAPLCSHLPEACPWVCCGALGGTLQGERKYGRAALPTQAPFLPGKMFKSLDLSLIVEFILMFYRDKPIDWLLDHILWVKVCNPEKDAVSKSWRDWQGQGQGAGSLQHELSLSLYLIT